MKTLIVPVDESELSERAVPVAGAMATALGGDLVLVVVGSANADRGPTESYLRSLHQRLPVGTPITDVIVGDDDAPVGSVIVREAGERPSAAVVMATHARTSLGELVLGSVAETVVSSSECPVVLVGPRCSTAWSPGTTVVAVDGSPVTDRVLEVAAAWAQATDVQLSIVHVRPPVALHDGAVNGDSGLVERAVARLGEAGVSAGAVPLESTSPATAVVRWATERGASLVIVGAHRHGRVHRALPGRVSMSIVRHAGCPVMVIGAEPSAS